MIRRGDVTWLGHGGDLEGVLGVGTVVRWGRDSHFGEGKTKV